ncbi:unnamed protein product [Cochlearia groenlandica]
MIQQQQQKVVVEGQGKAVPAPFLMKSYELVEESKTDNIVSWGEDDTTFVVWRPSEFARDLLPNYFKHNNFSSFVRQLNTYGFRKIVPERWEFSNEFFKRGQKHLLCQIHRRKTSHFLPPPPPPPHLPISGGGGGGYFSTTVNTEDHYCFDSPPSSSRPRVIITTVEAQVTALTEENERLRRNNNVLMSELANMKKLYNDIIYFVQNHVKHVSPSPLVYNYNNAIGGNYTYSSSSSPPSSITTFIEDDDDVMMMRTKTKLFGVSLQSSLNKKKKKKRYGHFSDQSNNLDNKTDLGLNLMTASSR